ncbi:MAG: metallophosphoesterase [Vagococcus sp.]|uniref:metallophosphoesterase n=1 Tax=Vagococcus sp. TaxID=1933889 RepID=UPI002FC66A82
MKYLVVSDNHGDRDILVNIATFWQDKVDGMFHCGDSELEPTDELWQKYVVVKGNCDYHPRFETESVISNQENTIYMTHGHLFNVNMGLTSLSLSARDKDATICLYGHTHKLAAEVVQGILFLNPGSISQPRGKYSHLKTYAIIETRAEQIEVTYYNRDHQVIDELSFVFSR